MRKVYVLVVFCLLGFIANAQVTATICSGVSTGNVGPIPTDQYTWLAPTGTGFIGSANATPGTLSVAPVNITAATVVAAYTVTDVNTSTTFTLYVTIQPVPDVTVSNQVQTVFNGMATAPIGFSGSVTGTTYPWTNNNTGIGSIGATGTGGIASFTTTANSLTTSDVATIIVTPKYNGCSGTPATVTVTSAPTHVVVCGSTIQNVSFNNTNAFAGTYTWTAPVVPGVTGITAGTAAAIVNQTLDNTTGTPQTVVYTLNEDGNATSFSLTVLVNPRPVVDPVASQVVCNGVLTSAIAFTTPVTSVAGTTYTWTNSLGSIGLATSGNTSTIAPFAATNATTATLTATITVTPFSNTCSGTPVTFSITVNPTPTLTTPTTSNLCTGASFSYTAASGVSGTSFAWSRAALASISSSGGVSSTAASNAIFESFTNTSVTPIGVAYVFTLTANGCANNQTLTLTVNPIPVITSQVGALTNVCNNLTFAYTALSSTPGATFAWTYSPTTSVTTSPTSGAGNISEVLVNGTITPASVAYGYTVAVNGCANSNVYSLTFDVNPSATLSGLTPTAVCSGSTFSYIANASTNPAITSYAWTRFSTAGVTASGAASGTSTTISQILDNSNLTAAALTYSFSVTAYGCVTTQNVIATVSPVPILSGSAPSPICSGSIFSYSPTNITPGTVFSWSRSVVAGMSPTSGNAGSNDPLETLVNTTPFPINVGYTYTLITPASCANSQSISVTVNPLPALSSALSITPTCSGTSFVYTPTSSTPTTAFSWSRAVLAPITNGVGAGSGSIAEPPLNNPSTAIATAIYTYTLTANGCANSQTVTIDVVPAPVVSTQALSACSNATFTLTPSSPVPAGTVYTWGVPTASVGAISNGFSQTNQPAVTGALTNLSITNAVADYTVVPSASGCVGSAFTVTVTLNPTPTLGAQSLSPTCSGAAFSFSASAGLVPAGTTYTWASPLYSPVGSLSGGSAQALSQTSFTQTLTTLNNLSNTATYQVVASAGTCSGSAFSLAITVNPVPVVSSFSNTSCSGASFSLTPTSSVTNTTYTWSAPTLLPGGSISNATAQGTPVSVIAQSLTNALSSTSQAVYTLVPVAASCAGSAFTFTAFVSGLVPSFSAANQQICSGAPFDVTPATAPGGTTYTWATPTTTGATGFSAAFTPQTNVSQVLNNGSPATVINTVVYTVVPTINSCQGTSFTATISVNPIPVITSGLNPTAICDNTSFAYSPTSSTSPAAYTWTLPPVTGITATGALTGTGSVLQPLLNNTTAPISVSYLYTVSTNGCANSSVFTVTFNVNPSPRLSSSPTPTAICSAATFTYAATSSTSPITYAWTRPGVSGINGGASTTNNSGNISEILTNANTTATGVTYLFTLTANGCANAQSVTVNVNASPTLSSSTTPSPICSGTVFNYSPTSNTPGTNFNWLRSTVTGISNSVASSTNDPNETLINTTSGAVNVTYAYSLVTPAGCSNTQSISVTVNPTPTFSSVTTASPVCSGYVFSYTPTSNTVGTSFAWARPTVTAISTGANAGTGGIAETLVNTTTSAASVAYNFTLTANTCTNNQTVTVSVNPTPVIGAKTTATCSNSPFSITPTGVPPGTLYSWGSPTFSPLGSISSVSGQTLQTSINQTLSNQTVNTSTASYTVVPATGGCIGGAFTVTVTVDPTPALSSQTLAAICSGTAFSYAATAAQVPVGTQYTWTVSFSPTITGAVAEPILQPNVSGTISSSASVPSNVYYAVVPATATCTGAVFTLTIPISPAPFIGNQNIAVCSGGTLSFTPSSTISGTTYTWPSPSSQPSGAITGGTNQAAPVTNITQVLTNTTGTAAQLVYNIIPSAGSCSGSAFTITANVGEALPAFANQAPICSGSLFNYSAPTLPATVTANWVRTTIPGISNTPASGSGSPAETLINTTSVPLVVTYNYLLVSNTGCSGAQQLTLTVNPIPLLSSNPTPGAICNGTLFTYTPASLTPGTVFNWSRASAPPVTNPPGSGVGNISETLINPTTSPAAVVYSYSLTANSCINNQLVTVSVNPIPVVPVQTAATCSNMAFSIVPPGQPAATTYTWSAPVITPLGSSAGGTAQPTSGTSYIGQTLNNQTVGTSTAVYTVTPNVNGCVGSAFTATITINPVPFVSPQVLPAVCSNTPFSFVASFVPTATSYTWGNPVLSPTGSMTGAGAQPVSQPAVSQTLVNNNKVNDTAFYSVVPATAFCVGSAFSMTVVVKPLPVVADLKDSICSNTNFFVSPSSGLNNTTFTWSAPVSTPTGAITGGSAQTLPASSISQTLVNNTTATAQTVYTIIPTANNCAGPSFTLIETVARPVPAFGNIPATICSGTSFDATPPAAPAGTTYTWTIPVTNPTGGVTGVSAATSRQPIVSQTLGNVLAVVDTVTYTVLPFLNNCQGPSFTATIRVQPITKAIISALTSVCQNPLADTVSLKLTGTAPWSFTYSDGISTLTKTGITSSPYTLTLPVYPKALTSRTITVTNVKDFACLNSTDTFTLTQKINALPVGTIVSLHGKYLCNGVTDTLLVQTSDSVGYQWKINNGAISGATTNGIATTSPGVYNVTLTNRYNCVDTAAVPYVLTYVQQPVLKFKIDTSCISSNTHFFNLTDTSATGTIKWLWKFGNGKTDTAMTGTTSYPIAGKFHVSLTATQLFCTSYPPTTFDSTIDVGAPLPPVTMSSISTYKLTLTPVQTRTFPNFKYLWTPSSGIQDPDSSSTYFQSDTSQLYLIKLISPLNCVTVDTLMVRVFDNSTVQIFVPKSFTPNNDGVNDILYPYLAGIKQFHFFRVLNRYGKLLFETRDENKGWNGMFNGGAQPMSVYFWVAEGTAADGSIVQKAGQVLLIR